MLAPLIMDSFFVCAIGVLTTAMISSSSQESVSAVSLVSPLYLMVYAVYNAVSAGAVSYTHLSHSRQLHVVVHAFSQNTGIRFQIQNVAFVLFLSLIHI